MDTSAFIGEIRQFAGNYPPRGWALCNGQSLSIAQYDTLFFLLGTTYGGDGISTFNLPNLQGRVPLHMGAGFIQGEAAGTESIQLLATQLPAHTHTVYAANDGGIDDPKGNFWGSSGSRPYSDKPDPPLRMNVASIKATGGSIAHENRIPFLAITYIIALEGIFPPRG